MQRTSIWIDLEKLLAAVLILAGLGGVIIALSADALGVGGQPGFGPNQVAVGIGGLALLLSGLVLRSTIDLRQIGEGFLVLSAVLAAAFAADLLIIGGLPGNGAKQIAMLSVVFSLAVVNITSSFPLANRSLGQWLRAIAIDRTHIFQFAGIVIQLGLLVLVLNLFKLENQAFYHNLSLLTFYGFILHFLLPRRQRLLFFLLLSVAAVLGLFGLGGVWLLGLGIGIIGLCHIPVPFTYRVILVLAAGLAIGFARGGVIPVPIPAAVWPIFGSIFMFRMIVYLYDLKHQKAETFNPTSTLAYFFMLPNLVFPLFPVIDYSGYRRTYYDKDQYQIYQTGIRWIFRGIFQLIVYRFVNYYLVLAPEAVTHAGDLVQFLVSNILLLVRVTGQFHIAVGILHLFGFNLPLTNNLYFLATSFTDFWRRANIYWKDFQLKVFYYPIYFRLKRYSDTFRLVVATVLVFVVTWALHGYQWFWLRGTYLLSAPDVLFWTFFGLLVLANSLYEARRGRKRKLGKTSWNFRETVVLSLQALGVFVTITLLWSLWTSPTVADFFGLWAVVSNPLDSLLDLWPLLLVVAAIFAAKFWFSWAGEENPNRLQETSYFFRDSALTGAAILIVFLLGTPAVHQRLGGRTGEVLADLTVSRLSARDADLLLRGYYEDLIGINRFNSELWEVYTKRPSDWPVIQNTEAATRVDGFEEIRLEPSISIDFHGAQFSTNRWGMRDKDYALTPDPNTYRIALVGPSFVMGSGVADDQTFDWIVEERLNELAQESGSGAVEILNFGVAGHSAIQELYTLETRALDFQPDAVYLIAHQLEIPVLIRNLADRLIKGDSIPYDFLTEIAASAGVLPGMTASEAERLLEPFGEELTLRTYQKFVALSRENGMDAVWIFLPTLDEVVPQDDIDRLYEIAVEAEFEIVNLRDLYAGQDLDRLIVAEWDRHPNVLGHQRIADHLYQELTQNPRVNPIKR